MVPAIQWQRGVTLGKSPMPACPILLGRVSLKHPARDQGEPFSRKRLANALRPFWNWHRRSASLPGKGLVALAGPKRAAGGEVQGSVWD